MTLFISYQHKAPNHLYNLQYREVSLSTDAVTPQSVLTLQLNLRDCWANEHYTENFQVLKTQDSKINVKSLAAVQPRRNTGSGEFKCLILRKVTDKTQDKGGVCSLLIGKEKQWISLVTESTLIYTELSWKSTKMYREGFMYLIPPAITALLPWSFWAGTAEIKGTVTCFSHLIHVTLKESYFQN